MRQLRKNQWKQLWYGLYHDEEPIYQTDEEGNIVYIVVDGVNVPVEIGTRPSGYEIAGIIGVNLAMSGGEAEAVQFGLDTSDYSAKFITANKGLFITESSLLWEKEPKVDEDNRADGTTADWKIVKISPSQNFVTYLLDRKTK